MYLLQIIIIYYLQIFSLVKIYIVTNSIKENTNTHISRLLFFIIYRSSLWLQYMDSNSIKENTNSHNFRENEKKGEFGASRRLIERLIQLFTRSSVKRNDKSIKVLKTFAKKSLKNKNNLSIGAKQLIYRKRDRHINGRTDKYLESLHL